MLDPLRAEGLTDVEVVGVLTNHSTWDFAYRPAEFDQVRYPLLLDPEGAVFYLYGTSSYEMIFVDRQLRLVNKQIFDSTIIPSVKQRLRELHAE